MLGCVGRHWKVSSEPFPSFRKFKERERLRDSRQRARCDRGWGRKSALACVRGVQCDPWGWPSARPWTRGAARSVAQHGGFHFKTLSALPLSAVAATPCA